MLTIFDAGVDRYSKTLGAGTAVSENERRRGGVVQRDKSSDEKDDGKRVV